MPAPLPSLRHTLRRLRRAPLFTTAALVTLAVAIGANTAIFTVINSVLLTPLPFEDPERLVGVWHTAPGLGVDDVNHGAATYLTYRDEGRVFEDIGLWDDQQVSITGRAEPEQVSAMMVTDGTLPLLRVRPRLGRVFSRDDDQPSGPETVILSDGYWRRRFAANPGILGQSLRVDGRPRVIVGVLPSGLRFLRSDPAIYLPFRFDRAKVTMGDFSYQGVARLKPGVTIAQANADVARMIPMAVEKFPGGITMQMLQQARLAPNLRPLKQDVVGDVGKVLWVLLGTVGIILLIACANVANLFLVRADGMQREMAVRTALGAGWWRVAREFLAESMTLGVAGGVGGVALAWAGVRLLVAMGPESLPRLNEIAIAPAVLAFAALVSVLAGVLFGIVPVIKYRRPNLVSALKEGGRANSAGRERHQARNALVVAQVALALILLTGSGLMIRSFQALRRVDPGFREPRQVLTLRLSVPPSEVPDEKRAAGVHEQVRQRLALIPGVTAVGMASSVTMDGNDSNNPVFVEDFPPQPGQIPPLRRIKYSSPEYFATMGNPVIAGRSFEWTDTHDRRPVAIVTEDLAREYWKEPAAAIGKRIRQDLDDQAPWMEIVGVVGNEHDDGVSQAAVPTAYFPLLATNVARTEVRTRRDLSYAIRSSRVGTGAFLDQVRQAVWSVNASLPLADVRTLDAILQRSMARTSFTLVMLGIAAGVALLLGAVGIYGVISYIVVQRTREFGVRMALGARRADVSGMVLRHGLALALAVLVAGLAGAAGLARLMASLLYGVRPVDLATYTAVSLTIAAIALLASWIPAMRATRIDPSEALRAE